MSSATSKDRLAAIADRLVAARRQGARIALAGPDAPEDYEEGFAIQDKVVAALASPVIGWKVMEVPGGPVIFAPILQSGRVAAGGTWEVVGTEPAGIELEIAFRLGSRRAGRRHARSGLGRRGGGPRRVRAVPEPDRRSGQAAAPRHARRLHRQRRHRHRSRDRRMAQPRTSKARPGRLLVDGKVHVEGKSVDPVAALQMLPPVLAARGKRLAAGQIVITGSLIGMNWLTSRHALEGIVDGCGKVAIELAAA